MPRVTRPEDHDHSGVAIAEETSFGNRPTSRAPRTPGPPRRALRGRSQLLEALGQERQGGLSPLIGSETHETEPAPRRHRTEHVQRTLRPPVDDQAAPRRPHPPAAAPKMVGPPRRLRLGHHTAEVAGRTPIAGFVILPLMQNGRLFRWHPLSNGARRPLFAILIRPASEARSRLPDVRLRPLKTFRTSCRSCKVAGGWRFRSGGRACGRSRDVGSRWFPLRFRAPWHRGRSGLPAFRP